MALFVFHSRSKSIFIFSDDLIRKSRFFFFIKQDEQTRMFYADRSQLSYVYVEQVSLMSKL